MNHRLQHENLAASMLILLLDAAGVAEATVETSVNIVSDKNIIQLTKEVDQDLGEDSISRQEEQLTHKQNWFYKIE